MELQSLIESLLFVSSKPLKLSDLVKLTGAAEGEVRAAAQSLVDQRANTGIVCLESNGGYQLATNAENTEVVKSFLNAELRDKLTDASTEVLSIVAYRQPIGKNEIEAIRGVNSQYSLRQLLMRGLIEKTAGDGRSPYYQTTTEFLQHMGLTSVNDLPDFDQLTQSIKLPDTAAASPEQSTEQPATEPEEQGDQVVVVETYTIPEQETPSVAE